MIEGLILAAGVGSRMGHLTASTPKCLVEIAPRQPILSLALESMNSFVARTVVVTGYMAHAVASHVAERDDVTPVFNPNYLLMSNTASLVLGLKQISSRSEVLLVEGDVVFDPEICSSLVGRGSTCTAVELWSPRSEGSFVTIDSRSDVETWSHAQHEEASRAPKVEPRYKTINVSLLSAEFVDECLKLADEQPNFCSLPIELLFDRLVQQGQRVRAAICDDLSWAEVDTPDDLEEARGVVQ